MKSADDVINWLESLTETAEHRETTEFATEAARTKMMAHLQNLPEEQAAKLAQIFSAIIPLLSDLKSINPRLGMLLFALKRWAREQLTTSGAMAAYKAAMELDKTKEN